MTALANARPLYEERPGSWAEKKKIDGRFILAPRPRFPQPASDQQRSSARRPASAQLSTRATLAEASGLMV